MEKLIEELIVLVKRGDAGRTPEQPRAVQLDASGAPHCVRALVDVLATSAYKVDLGEFLLRDPRTALTTLAASVEAGVEMAEIDDLEAHLATAGPDGAVLDLSHTLVLGQDGGGNSALGVGWSGDRAFGVIVELADPVPRNLVRVFPTAAAWLDALDHINRRRGKSPDVEALRAAAQV